MPSLLNDLGRHPVRRALHRTKDVASTHAEILKQNHEPEVRFLLRVSLRIRSVCRIPYMQLVWHVIAKGEAT